jgi:hypothetical protein
MQKFLFALCLSALAAPALATDSGDAAFELLAKYSAETQQKNFIKLQSAIDITDAKSIDAKISEIYGAPKVDRSGLKVWEVKNTTGRGPKFTTIMCGPDKEGGIWISADRRGKAVTKAAKGRERPSPKSPPIGRAKKSKVVPRALERD